MTRVLHTGDTHIGYQQYHSPERREDFLSAFRQVVEDAIEGDVAAVVHAGDLFHDRRPGLTDLQGTVAALRRLRDAGVPFLAVVGNHETKRDAQWLDLFEDLGLATRLGSDPVTVGNTAFYGLDYVPEAKRDDLDYEFAPHDADHAALVAHGLFEPFAHADWDTETVLESASVDFDAVLLGDNHAHGVKRVLDTWVTYCGSTERASASERDDRGYNLVTFDDGVDVTRRGLDTRDFVFVDVDLGEGEGVDRVREQVRQYDLTDAVVHVDVDGEGEPVTPAAVEETALEGGALVARAKDRREIEAEVETDVTFADPDDAVRERVQDLGLSAAARGLDETVRSAAVADANVRDEVERHVREHLDEDDLAAFRGTDDEDHESSPVDGTTDAATDATETTDEAAATSETDDEVTDETTVEDDRTTDDGDQTTDGDDQISMEDYL